MMQSFLKGKFKSKNMNSKWVHILNEIHGYVYEENKLQ